MTYEDIVFDYNSRALDDRTWDMISDRERVEFVLRMKGGQEPVDGWVLQEVKFDEAGIPYDLRDPQPAANQGPVAYRYWHDEFACWNYDDADARTVGVKSEPLFATLPPYTDCDAQIEAFRSAVVSRCLAFGNLEHTDRVQAEAEALANLKEAIRGNR